MGNLCSGSPEDAPTSGEGTNGDNESNGPETRTAPTSFVVIGEDNVMQWQVCKALGQTSSTAAEPPPFPEIVICKDDDRKSHVVLYVPSEENRRNYAFQYPSSNYQQGSFTQVLFCVDMLKLVLSLTNDATQIDDNEMRAFVKQTKLLPYVKQVLSNIRYCRPRGLKVDNYDNAKGITHRTQFIVCACFGVHPTDVNDLSVEDKRSLCRSLHTALETEVLGALHTLLKPGAASEGKQVLIPNHFEVMALDLDKLETTDHDKCASAILRSLNDLEDRFVFNPMLPSEAAKLRF
eukprot:GFYU01002581.1.p1 GENE.GFYU01002581.1~~GFYU01002581.1.p1  ORF type:complete len:292 (-),score=33.23 GFYU01002581.1:430-1305(-)